MYGALLGDMIGAPYEFDRGDKTKDFPLFSKHSQFTDDSVMTIAIAEALTDALPDAAKDWTEHRIVSAMQNWGRKYPDAGYGGRFRCWLRKKNPKPYNSWGNGSAMRVSAVGWLYDTLEKTEHMAELTAKVTHNHPEGIKGAVVTAGIIFLARNGAPKEVIRAYAESKGYDLSRSCDEIRPDYHHVESCQETVPEAITAFLEGTDFEDVIRTAVSLGGDCDTLTCIAGSMAEAFYGVPAWLKEECEKRLPEDMRKILAQFNRHRMQITVKDDWTTKEMPEKHEVFTLHRTITESDRRILRMGHIPEEMEDKWFWYMEGNRLFAHRSWTGINVFIVDIDAGGAEHQVIANRNPEEYGGSAAEDERRLNQLLGYWTRPVYDYYSEWLQETIDNIEKQQTEETR